MESIDCPFKAIDNILEKVDKDAIIVVDFHAEATSEKRALGYYLDGKVSAFFGTHTHVPTADEIIFPKGTGYITDVGMTGVINSALGVKFELVIKKLKNAAKHGLKDAKSFVYCLLLINFATPLVAT